MFLQEVDLFVAVAHLSDDGAKRFQLWSFVGKAADTLVEFQPVLMALDGAAMGDDLGNGKGNELVFHGVVDQTLIPIWFLKLAATRVARPTEARRKLFG